MAEQTGIQWTDATVNFWWGCTKVGPGCNHCYAETWSKRTGESIWGVGAPRRKIKSALKILYKLQNEHSWWAADHHIGRYHDHSPQRVFLQSMSDLFDAEVPIEWFAEAWGAITTCRNLELQLVTKRLPNVEKRLAEIGAAWPSHAGLIISVVNQAEADRDVPRLLALKKRLGVPWVGLSMEPLLGPVDLSLLMYQPCPNSLDGLHMDPETGSYECCSTCDWSGISDEVGIDWVIVGGESGQGARPMHPDWARSLRDQCEEANVPFFFKQWGEWAASGPHNAEMLIGPGASVRHTRLQTVSVSNAPKAGQTIVTRVGKKVAGRLLDGIEHNGFPEVVT